MANPCLIESLHDYCERCLRYIRYKNVKGVSGEIEVFGSKELIRGLITSIRHCYD